MKNRHHKVIELADGSFAHCAFNSEPNGEQIKAIHSLIDAAKAYAIIRKPEFLPEGHTVCQACKGQGTPPPMRAICQTCKGTGTIPKVQAPDCKRCHGIGFIPVAHGSVPDAWKKKCPKCEGTGKEPK